MAPAVVSVSFLANRWIYEQWLVNRRALSFSYNDNKNSNHSQWMTQHEMAVVTFSHLHVLSVPSQLRVSSSLLLLSSDSQNKIISNKTICADWQYHAKYAIRYMLPALYCIVCAETWWMKVAFFVSLLLHGPFSHTLKFSLCPQIFGERRMGPCFLLEKVKRRLLPS